MDHQRALLLLILFFISLLIARANVPAPLSVASPSSSHEQSQAGGMQIYSPSEKEYIITLDPSLVLDPSLQGKGAPIQGQLSSSAQSSIGISFGLPFLENLSPEEKENRNLDRSNLPPGTGGGRRSP